MDTLDRHDRRRLDPHRGHVRLRAVLPGRVAQLRRLRQGPPHAVRRRTSSSTASGTSTARRTTRRACCCGTATCGTRSTRSTPNSFNPPSIGSKGQLLLVDAHYDPARRAGRPAANDPCAARQPAVAAAGDGRGVRHGRALPVPAAASRPSGDPYDLACNRFGRRAPAPGVQRRRTWYPGTRVPARPRPRGAAVLPGRRRLGRGAVDGQRDLLDPHRRRATGGSSASCSATPSAAATCSAPATRATAGRPPSDGSDPGTTEDLSLGVHTRVLRAGDSNTRVLIVVRPGHRR